MLVLRNISTAYISSGVECLWVQCGSPIHFKPIHFIFAYTHVLLRDQPLQHRKRFYTWVWRLRHPTFLLGSAIQRIMSNSFAYRHTSERVCSTSRFGVPALISFVLLFSKDQTKPNFFWLFNRFVWDLDNEIGNLGR